MCVVDDVERLKQRIAELESANEDLRRHVAFVEERANKLQAAVAGVARLAEGE